MREVGADTRADMPRPGQERGDGIAKSSPMARQARSASDEYVQDETTELLEKVLCRENMKQAYRKVVQNGGAPGVDGMTVEALKSHCQDHWPEIRQKLREGTYEPQPIRRVDIPKPNGGTRTLGIPTVVDRMIQQALLQVLTPIFEPTFSDASYGYRPGRGAHDAVQRARGHIAEGHRWVVDIDLESFFDRVNHDVLMARVARRVKDKQVLRLIRRYLQAGMMEAGLVSSRHEGTPQGGPLSPLLSNILLDDLDKELEQRGHRFVRYADDCNIYVRSKQAGERVMASLERFLWERLRLRINQEKSAVEQPWKRKFLGYSFRGHKGIKLRVAPESVKRLKDKLRPLMRIGRGRGLACVITQTNHVLKGWINYFWLAENQTLFEELDGWIRRKLRCIVWRQWKTPRTRHRKLKERQVSHALARKAAWGGSGPWRSAASHAMQAALPNRTLRAMGLVSLSQEYRRLVCMA